MTQTRWVTSFTYIHQDMERLLTYIGSSKPPAVRFSRLWEPAVDVYETDDEIVVLAELAGLNQDQDQVQVAVRRDSVLIVGDREDTGTQKPRIYHQLEIGTGRFERAVRLPAAVDPDRTRASFKDGMLEIVLPKMGTEPRQVRVA